MSASTPTPPSAAESDTDGGWPLSRLFILIVLTEIITIAGLYWFGRHFS
jgi:hypothetical protein